MLWKNYSFSQKGKPVVKTTNFHVYLFVGHNTAQKRYVSSEVLQGTPITI